MRSGSYDKWFKIGIIGLNPFFIRECVLASNMSWQKSILGLNPFFIRECVLALARLFKKVMWVLIPSLSGNAFWQHILASCMNGHGLNPFFIRECVLAVFLVVAGNDSRLNPFFIRECVLAESHRRMAPAPWVLIPSLSGNAFWRTTKFNWRHWAVLIPSLSGNAFWPVCANSYPHIGGS